MSCFNLRTYPALLVFVCLPLLSFSQEWGGWNNVSCWQGLQYRFKRTGDSNGRKFWDIQFRNNYNQQVSFNFNIINPEEAELAKALVAQKRSRSVNASNRLQWTDLAGRGSGRIANMRSASVESSFGNTTSVSVALIVFEFRFGDDNTEKKYAACGSNINNEDFYEQNSSQTQHEQQQDQNQSQQQTTSYVQPSNNDQPSNNETPRSNQSNTQTKTNQVIPLVSTTPASPQPATTYNSPTVQRTSSAEIFSQQLPGLINFINERFGNSNASWDGDWNNLSTNELMYGSARMRKFYKTGEEEDRFKEVRAQLYESIEYYSGWYSDSLVIMSPAKSGISFQTGEPDHVKYKSHAVKEKAKAYVDDGDGYNLAKFLQPELMSPMDIRVGRDYPDYHRRMFNFLDDLQYGKYDKAKASEFAKADKGKLEPILNTFWYYGTPENADGNANYKEDRDLKKLDKYFNQFINHPEVQNGKISSAKIMTGWVILHWAGNHYRKQNDLTEEQLREMLERIRHAQKLFDPEQFKKGKSNLFGERFQDFYVLEQYFSSYFLAKSAEMRVLLSLYDHAMADEQEEFDQQIIQVYADVASTLKPIFGNPILDRPFTNDDNWSENHRR